MIRVNVLPCGERLIKSKTNMANVYYTEGPMPSFRDLESGCESHFRNLGPCWHICTPGASTEIVFTCDEDFTFGITLLALCVAELDLKILSFELMSNHYHIIVAGSREECLALSRNYQKRLGRYFSEKGRPVSLSNFVCEDPIEITSLEMIRSEITYVNRNGYVVNPFFTPYTYPWGCGKLYFTDFDSQIPSQSITEFSVRQLRSILHTKAVKLPIGYRIRERLIIPSSFCSISDGEKLFRNAGHYFQAVTRNAEAFSEIAKRLGDKVFIPDNEMYSVAFGICRKNFGCDSLTMLSARQRIDTAKILKFKYNANVKQIKRILKLDDTTLRELFPATF